MAPPTNAPPAQDTSRNEYIPSFIASKPFYVTDDLVSSDADYLEHQRLHSAPKDTLDKAKWYDRGKKLGPAATKFRKGACENCGAMTHKTKECLSRPRKTGAKYTGRDIQADERIESVSLGWDAKRDRWNGYDPKEYDSVVKEYEELEALKKSTATTAGSPSQKALEPSTTSTDDPTSDAARYDAETDMGRSQPTSTRQLRLREDTAGYLRNLDLDSAAYDPKTRTLDGSTKTLTDPSAGGDLADQGFMRPSESEAFERAQRYAWEAQESGAPNAAKLHLQANPTEGAMLMRKAEAEAREKRDAQRKYLAERYGSSSAGTPEAAASSNGKAGSGSASAPNSTPSNTAAPAKKKPPRAVSTYIEYDARGVPLNAPKAPVAKSKYPEDVFPNNHSSVFGSWWAKGVWGYRCCHSTVRNSWCAGEEGRRAFEEESDRRVGMDLLGIEGPGGEGESAGAGADGVERADEVGGDSVGKGDGEKERETKKRPRDAEVMYDGGVSEEAMEQYKRSKLSAQDPMAGMLGRDELVD
jgi:pre-mRNA-processing factor SLU7